MKKDGYIHLMFFKFMTIYTHYVDIPRKEYGLMRLATIKYLLMGGILIYFGSWFILAIWFARARNRASRNSEWFYQGISIVLIYIYIYHCRN